MAQYHGELWITKQTLLQAFGMPFKTPARYAWIVRINSYNRTTAGIKEKYHFGTFKGFVPNPIQVQHEVELRALENLDAKNLNDLVLCEWTSKCKTGGQHITAMASRVELTRPSSHGKRLKKRTPKEATPPTGPSPWECWEKANAKAYKRAQRIRGSKKSLQRG